MMQRMHYALYLALALGFVTTAAGPVPESVYTGTSWRQIGPFRGGVRRPLPGLRIVSP
jgi:hypothetical protein